MPNRILRRAAVDVTAAAAAYLGTGSWLAFASSPGALAGFLAVGAGAAVLAWTAGSILLRATPVCTPADRVTLVRAVLVACCAALTVAAAAAFSRQPSATLLVILGAAAFVLDAVDGPVARHTRTASAAGARLDTETDAALTLVLSIAAAPALGAWTLLIGLLYYAFAAAGRLRPALKEPLPASPLRKGIGALQPFALLLALTPGVPAGVGTPALLAAGALLVFSFGRDIAVLERLHRARPVGAGSADAFR